MVRTFDAAVDDGVAGEVGRLLPDSDSSLGAHHGFVRGDQIDYLILSRTSTAGMNPHQSQQQSSGLAVYIIKPTTNPFLPSSLQSPLTPPEL